MGLVSFGGVCVFIQSQDFPPASEKLRNNALIIVAIVAIISVLMSNILYKKKLLKCKSKTNLNEKLHHYKSGIIIRFFIIDCAAILALVLYLLTGDIIILAIGGLLTFLLIMLRPTKEKLFNELQLNSSEISLLNNPNTIVDVRQC